MAQSAGPSLDVSVEGTAVAGGEQYPVGGDPTIEIEAESNDGAPIDLIVVEVDGSVYEEFDVNAQSVTREVTPEITSGVHDVEVIVRTADEALTSLAFTVRKDSGGPYVWLTAPYDSEPRRGTIADGTVGRAVVTFEGRIDEPSGPVDLQFTRGHPRTGRATSVDQTVDGDSFAQRLTLGDGRNEISIVAEDALRNIRTYEFAVTLDDTQPPQIQMNAPRQTDAERITAEFTVTDNVWVNRTAFETDQFTDREAIRPQPYNPNRDRRSVTFERSVRLTRGENRLTVRSRDKAGNVETQTFVIDRTSGTVGYRKPVITVERDPTDFSGARTVRVRGSISGSSVTTATIQTRVDGERTSYRFLHRGEPTDQVAISETLDVGAGETTVIVRAEDERGNTTTERFVVDAEAQAIRFGGDAGGDTAVVTEESTDGEGGAEGTPAVTPTPESRRDGGAKVGGVLLDQDHRRLGQVTVQDTTYDIYAIQNFLPYASGVEVYADGTEVTDDGTVTRVFNVLAARRVLEAGGYEGASNRANEVTSESAARTHFKQVAWQTAVSEVDESDLQAMRQTVAVARDIEQLTGRVGGAIDGILGFVDWMQQAGLAGVTVWDLATSASPQLEPFVDSLESLRSDLRAWEQQASQVTSSVPSAIERLERAKAGDEVDYAQLSRDLTEAMDAMVGLRSRTDTLQGKLRNIADTAGQIGRALGSVQGVGGQLADRFTGFSSFMDDRADQVGQFSDRLDSQANQLRQVRATAQSEQDRLMNQWRTERDGLRSQWVTRQSAGSKVQLTLGGGIVGLAGALFLIRRRWG